MNLVSMRRIILFFIAGVTLFTACKKSGDGVPKSGTRDELTKDSIYLYAQQVYLWNDVLPSYKDFKPRQYSSFDDVVEALKGYKLNSSGKPLDKYSFIDNGSVSDELGEGISDDYGFFIRYNGVDPLDLRVIYVYSGSPAATAGLERGDQIIQLNGRTDLDGRKDATIDFLNDAFFGSGTTMSLQIKKKDGTVRNATVNAGSYKINPILASKVITAGSKKLGYFALNSFLQIHNYDSQGNPINTTFKSQLDAVLSNFQSSGINELIVDLRYNGGGSVETADYLANYFAPASQNGQTMHSDYFNQTMQQGKATILKNQKFWDNGTLYSYFDIDYTTNKNVTQFKTQGSLNLSRVYFLVSNSTASASELLINSLKPVIDVKLIGETTYGKPVGFFAIHIDKYDLYIPEFQTKNQSGSGDYFDGLPVDKEATESITTDFGDESERYLSYAINYSKSGSYTVSSASVSSTAGQANRMSAEKVREVTGKLESRKFKGMVESRVRHNR